MIREIHEQPEMVTRLTARGESESFPLPPERLRKIEAVMLVGSGASRHAALVAQGYIERACKVPATVEFSGQSLDRDAVALPGQLGVFISQSGTTSDTREALAQAKRKGVETLAVCNAADSPLAREADHFLDVGAGPELSVAATKSFTGQVLSLYRLAEETCRAKGMSTSQRISPKLSEKMRDALSEQAQAKSLARRLDAFRHMLLIGAGASYGIALEGALKMKESAYLHAEAIPTLEVKHGPNAVVESDTPVVIISSVRDDEPSMKRHRKCIVLAEEFRSRDVPVLFVSNDKRLPAGCELLRVPDADEHLSPLLEIIPLQLLAYELGVLRGIDVDRPRNLTKSVQD